MIKKYIIHNSLLIILVLSALLRFWHLGTYPALNADEAALGYNAYSLIQTGSDEHGNPWPIHFQSFNDFKPGGYVYMILPFVRVFGLSIWSVRFLGAALGVGTVYLIYLLCEELFSEKLQVKSYKLKVSEIAAFLLAISPWHIHFSRGAWEVNVATFFITLGLWLFIKAMKKEKLCFLILSVVSFIVSLYTYHSARLIVPLLGVGLLVIYRKELLRNLKTIIVAAVVGFILLIPLGLDFVKGSVLSRAAGVGLFADTGPLSRVEEQRGEHGDFTAPIPKLLHNKAVNYGLAFLDNWTSHFEGEFLFESGEEIQRNKVPETGEMYMIDVVWIVLGIWWLVKNWKDKGIQVVVWWLVIAPTAAALTFQSPHALRAQNMVIPLIIIAAVGLNQILEWLKSKSRYLLVFGSWTLVILISWSFARYQLMYWKHMSREYPYSSQYGVKELVDFVESKKNEYEHVIVTDRYDQPYILFLFYTKYPPEKFQKEHTLTEPDGFGFSTVRSFDKYSFVSIDYDSLQPNSPRSLIAGTDEEIPDEANVIKNIYGTNGFKYFQVVAN